jgi:hypothetical protein
MKQSDGACLSAPAQSRLDQFRVAQAKAVAVAAATARARPAEKAAKWFAQYGAKCVGKDAGEIEWTPTFAGSCDGAREAAGYIEAAVTMMLPTIIREAEELAEADMTALVALFSSDSDGIAQDTSGGSHG